MLSVGGGRSGFVVVLLKKSYCMFGVVCVLLWVKGRFILGGMRKWDVVDYLNVSGKILLSRVVVSSMSSGTIMNSQEVGWRGLQRFFSTAPYFSVLCAMQVLEGIVGTVRNYNFLYSFLIHNSFSQSTNAHTRIKDSSL